MSRDSVFQALADPSRRKILSLLRRKDLSVTEIGRSFRFTGATLSHHLDVLKSAGLIAAERRGQFIFYSLNTSVLEDVLGAFYSLFS